METMTKEKSNSKIKKAIINADGKYIVERIKSYCNSCQSEKLMIARYCNSCGTLNK